MNRKSILIAVVSLVVFASACIVLYETLRSENKPDCKNQTACEQAYLDYARKNDPGNKLPDNVILVRGVEICNSLRTGNSPLTIAKQLHSLDPDFSVFSGTVLIKGAAKHLCADQERKVNKEL